MKIWKNKNGFTLIELLAVITILGILMVIAVPSINAIITNSRKNVYITDAKTYISDARNSIVAQEFDTNDLDTTYYIHINNFNDESVKESPFAAWKDAYVGVVRMEDGTYQYYWTSDDMAGWRVDLTKDTSLKRGLVYQDASKRVNVRQPIGDREKIVVIDKDGNFKSFKPWLELTRAEASVCYSFTDLSDTEIMLARYFVSDDCDRDVIVPAVVGGKLVTSINQYTFEDMDITSVFIPESVKTIGTRAFANNELTSVYIPSSVTKIDSEAFLNNKINDLVIEEGLKTMGTRAFRKNKLTAAVIPDSVTSLGSCSYCDNPIPNPSFLYVKNDYSRIRGYIGDLSEFTDKRFIIPSVAVDEAGNSVELKTIESSAFSRMSLSGWEVVIPNTVTHIKSSAFWDSGIAKINIPASVKNIETCAFKDNRLTEINIPASVTSIGEYAFNSNRVPESNLAQAWIYARNSDGTINYSKLIGYAGLNRSNVIIPASRNGVALKTIGKNAFRELNLTGTVRIPSSVTSIESLAFSQNRLTNILNGESDTGNNGPFAYARTSSGIDYSTLVSYGGYNTNVVIPNTVTKISSYAFYRSYIKGVTLPNNLKTIGSNAFAYNYIVDKVVIPASVTSIGSKAFYKVVSWGDFNANLNKIVNKTNNPFDWQSITGGPSPATFVTGTVENWYGDIEVVAE